MTKNTMKVICTDNIRKAEMACEIKLCSIECWMLERQYGNVEILKTKNNANYRHGNLVRRKLIVLQILTAENVIFLFIA
jgi:hypothetical protein